MFDITRTPHQLSIRFSSTLEHIDDADRETRDFLDALGFHTLIFDVCLCMREGMTNAVRHAHRLDARKIVRYSLIAQSDRLVIEIEDEGSGTVAAYLLKADSAYKPGGYKVKVDYNGLMEKEASFIIIES